MESFTPIPLNNMPWVSAVQHTGLSFSILKMAHIAGHHFWAHHNTVH